MLDYISSLLPRLQQFSKSLNDTAIFADVPWAFLDGDGERVTYIFRRNNELLVSKHGEVTTGRWEYLAAMQSLLIEHANRNRMYNQGFVDNVVMALRKDGTDELFLLANQQALPDLDAVKYLERKVEVERTVASGAKKNNDVSLTNNPLQARLQPNDHVKVELINPYRIILVQISESAKLLEKGNAIYDANTGAPLESGLFETNNGFKLKIRDGQIIDVDDDKLPVSLSLFILFVVALIIAFIYYTQ